MSLYAYFLPLGLILFFFLLEILYQYLRLPSELTRKIAQVVISIAALFAAVTLPREEYLFSFSIILIFLLISYNYNLLLSIHLTDRKTYGELLQILSLILLGYLYYEKRRLFFTGIFLLTIPDTLAWVAGMLQGQKKKTCLGSLVYFFSCYLVFLGRFSYPQALFMAPIFTALEYISLMGFDNFTVAAAYIIFVFFSIK